MNLNFLGDMQPGIANAIAYFQWKREQDMREQDQKVRHSYMNKLMEAMSERAKQRYFENQQERRLPQVPKEPTEEFQFPEHLFKQIVDKYFQNGFNRAQITPSPFSMNGLV